MNSRGFSSWVTLSLLLFLLLNSLLSIVYADLNNMNLIVLWSKIMKNAGQYATACGAIIIYVLYDSVKKRTEAQVKEKEKQTKTISELGQIFITVYKEGVTSVTHLGGDGNPEPRFFVNLIINEDSFRYINGYEQRHVLFLDSTDETTSLRNILVFCEEYFLDHETEIGNNYFSVCSKIEYESVGLSLLSCRNHDDSYFHLCELPHSDSFQNLFLTGITSNANLVLLKLKVKATDTIAIYQQSQYFFDGSRFIEVYKW